MGDQKHAPSFSEAIAELRAWAMDAARRLWADSEQRRSAVVGILIGCFILFLPNFLTWYFGLNRQVGQVDKEATRIGAYRDAMNEVNLKEDQIWRNMVAELKEAQRTNWFGAPGVFSKGYVRLSMIDTSKCPDDFRQVFAEELAITKELVEVFEASQGFGNRIANALTYGAHSDIRGFLAYGDLQRRLENVLLKKSIVMEKHGIRQETTK